MDPQTDDVNTVHDELLDSEITEDEVRKAIRRLQSGKAAGADEVINEFLKSTERVILPFLVKLCNASFNQGNGPSPLSFHYTKIKMETVVTPIITEESLCAHSARSLPPS